MAYLVNVRKASGLIKELSEFEISNDRIGSKKSGNPVLGLGRVQIRFENIRIRIESDPIRSNRIWSSWIRVLAGNLNFENRT